MKQIYLNSILGKKKVGIVLNYAIQNSRFSFCMFALQAIAKIAKRILIISEKIEILFTVDCYAMKSVHFKCDLRV